MYKLGAYNQNNRMSDLVCDNYPVLLVMSRFGIALGFGDKSIGEVCRENGVHTETFLAVVNLLLDEGDVDDYKNVISTGALLEYLHNSHDYFLNFRLPAIRCNLLNAIDGGEKDISIAILRFQKIPACENPVPAHLPANNLHNESVRHYRLHTLCKNYRQFLYRQFAESDHQFLPAVLTAERNRFSSNSFQ